MKNLLFTAFDQTFEIYSVRKDEKIYFRNTNDFQEEFNTSLTDFHKNLENGSYSLI